MVKQLRSPWLNAFLKIEPANYLTKVRCPVLALNGEQDIQVDATNIAIIESAVRNGGNKNVFVKSFPELNHLFQKCIDCTTREYYSLDETINVEVLDTIGKWADTTRR